MTKEELFRAGVLVDLDDEWLLDNYSWSIHKSGCRKQKYIEHDKLGRFHRFILNVPSNMVVDHINGNGLDNRRINLRIVTKAVNCQHRVTLDKRNTSGYRGVYFDKNKNKFCARVQIDGKRKVIGMFTSPLLAGKAVEEYLNKHSSAYIKK